MEKYQKTTIDDFCRLMKELSLNFNDLQTNITVGKFIDNEKQELLLRLNIPNTKVFINESNNVIHNITMRPSDIRNTSIFVLYKESDNNIQYRILKSTDTDTSIRLEACISNYLGNDYKISIYGKKIGNGELNDSY